MASKRDTKHAALAQTIWSSIHSQGELSQILDAAFYDNGSYSDKENERRMKRFRKDIELQIAHILFDALG